MTVRVEDVEDAGSLSSEDVTVLLALEVATQQRPVALATLLHEVAPSRMLIVARQRAEGSTTDGGGAIVGFASARAIDDEVHVVRLAVDAARRRRGIGRALLDGLVARARELGAGSVVLEVRAGDVAARTLYGAAGFTQDGLRPRYYPDGEDARLLRLALDVSAAPTTSARTGVPAGGV